MIKTIGGNNQTCITIIKNGKIVMNITANSGSTGYIDIDKCNAQTHYDNTRQMIMVRIEV